MPKGVDRNPWKEQNENARDRQRLKQRELLRYTEINVMSSMKGNDLVLAQKASS